MSRFARSLGDLIPRTGRLITESGESFNEADWRRLERDYSLLYQTVNERAVRLSCVESGIDVDDYYFGLRVPEGKRLVISGLSLNVTEGKYIVRTSRVADGFTNDENSITMLQNKLFETEDHSGLESEFYCNVQPIGSLEPVEEIFIDVGSTIGANRPTSAANFDGAVIAFTGSRVIDVERAAGGGPYDIGLLFVCWEIEDA